jgi:DNA replication protein DnaC
MRKLTSADLQSIRLPERFWTATFEQIVDGPASQSSQDAPKALVGGYLSRLALMRSMGAGLLLWGPNGTGKTSIGALLLKQARREGFKAMFLEAAAIKTLVVDRVMYDAEAGKTVWARAFEVDFLLLDDLGKGSHDSQGFGERLVDELIRDRYANKRPTIITTNVDKSRLGEIIKPSTLHTLKGSCAQIKVAEHDYRAQEGADLRKIIMGGDQ